MLRYQTKIPISIRIFSSHIYVVWFSDINECETGAHRCQADATCNNTIGWYNCTCNPGFDGSGTNCTGNLLYLNQWQERFIRKGHIIQNTVISECSKYVTYITFSDIDECALATHDCHLNANCTNMNGTHNCTCNDGYSGDGFTCEGRFLFQH